MAGIANSIHFRGIAAVLKAYNDRDVSAWALWQKNQFITKGMDDETLQTFLNELHKHGSEAVYTLKVYEGVTDPSAIKEKTPCDGSFNFRLNEPSDYPGMGVIPYQGRSASPDRLAELEDKVNLLCEKLLHDEGEDEPEEDSSIAGLISGVLRDPDKLGKYLKAFRELTGGTSYASPAYVGNVTRLPGASMQGNPNPVASGGEISQEEKLQRLGAAIDVLDRCDPLLHLHLEKLASIAAGKPDQFKMLLSMLDMQ
jgi:hypothetical protein